MLDTTRVITLQNITWSVKQAHEKTTAGSIKHTMVFSVESAVVPSSHDFINSFTEFVSSFKIFIFQ